MTIIGPKPKSGKLERRYPSFVAADGRRYHVDEWGIIDGRIEIGPHAGELRSDYPLAPPTTVDILSVITWIEARGLIRQRTPTAGSYAAKHWAERWLGRYVTNGATIIAFGRMGYQQHVDHSLRGAVNTSIGIVRRSYVSLPEVTGPISPLAEIETLDVDITAGSTGATR